MSERPTDHLHAMRTDYVKGELVEAAVAADPLEQFERWFAEAEAAKVPEPNAMTLATASKDGVPAARIVLLKALDDRGFTFYTNYESQKGRDLAANARACLLFFWEPLARQVRIDGTVERVDRETSREYFNSRPRESRIGANASHQSQVIASREVLEQEFARLSAQFGEDVPLPDTWGGYRVIPTTIELWQGRPSRLHDRLRYRRDRLGEWTLERLSP